MRVISAEVAARARGLLRRVEEMIAPDLESGDVGAETERLQDGEGRMRWMWGVSRWGVRGERRLPDVFTDG